MPGEKQIKFYVGDNKSYVGVSYVTDNTSSVGDNS